jgi:hypothetical protein
MSGVSAFRCLLLFYVLDLVYHSAQVLIMLRDKTSCSCSILFAYFDECRWCVGSEPHVFVCY